MKISTLLGLLIATLAFSNWAFAASEEDGPEQPIDAAYAPAQLPLELYRSLRAKFSKLAEGESVGGETLAALQIEIRAHESEIFRAASATQALQREIAARSLAHALNKKDALAILCKLLKKDRDKDVRRAAALAIGHIGDAETVEALMRATEDSSEDVRQASVMALGKIRDERAVPALMQTLRSGDRPALRAQSALALSQIRSGIDEKDLSSALDQESDDRVRMAIAAAIRQVNGSDNSASAALPNPDEYTQKLMTLSTDMSSVAGKLRDDRHDQAVQVDGKNIERKLDDLISSVQEMQQQAMQQQQARQKKDWRNKVSEAAGPRAPAGRPGKGGKESSPDTLDNPINPRSVVGRSSDTWASLPAKDREELLQIYGAEVPVRWKKRLEAYFVSIAAEEAKGAEPPVKEKERNNK